MIPGRVSWLRGASRAAVLAMYTAGMLVSAWAFPFGGGEFHAMFAYSDQGRIPRAFMAFRVHVGTVCAVAALLLAARYRLRWQVVALAASVTAGSYWWDVYTWPRQSEAFHRTAGLMMIAIPLVAFAACGAAHALRRRVLTRIAARAPAVTTAAG